MFTHTVQKLKGTKIHRMQQMVNSDRVPGVGKTRMSEGWCGREFTRSSNGLCYLCSLLPEATLLLCVCCYDFYSPISHPEEPQTGMQGAADRSGADQREVVN